MFKRFLFLSPALPFLLASVVKAMEPETADHGLSKVGLVRLQPCKQIPTYYASAELVDFDKLKRDPNFRNHFPKPPTAEECTKGLYSFLNNLGIAPTEENLKALTGSAEFNEVWKEYYTRNKEEGFYAIVKGELKERGAPKEMIRWFGDKSAEAHEPYLKAHAELQEHIEQIIYKISRNLIFLSEIKDLPENIFLNTVHLKDYAVQLDPSKVEESLKDFTFLPEGEEKFSNLICEYMGASLEEKILKKINQQIFQAWKQTHGTGFLWWIEVENNETSEGASARTEVCWKALTKELRNYCIEKIGREEEAFEEPKSGIKEVIKNKLEILGKQLTMNVPGWRA